MYMQTEGSEFECMLHEYTTYRRWSVYRVVLGLFLDVTHINIKTKSQMSFVVLLWLIWK